MKNYLLSLCFLLGVAAAYAQHDQQTAVYFETDKAILTEEATASLDNFIQKVLSQNDYTITVKAHTDDRGSAAYNDALANRRAQSVNQYLTTKGIVVEKIETQSFGEKNPLYANTDDEGRSKNRRVDVLATLMQFNSTDDLLTTLNKGNTQTYYVNTEKNTIIYGKNGTSIYVEKGAFRLADGSKARGTVELSLVEAYSYKDMLLNDLSTTSGQLLLETGGMLNISAQVNGETLTLNPETPLQIGMPTNSQQNDMQLFNGVADVDGNLDWQPVGQFAGTSTATFRPFGESRPIYYFDETRFQQEYAHLFSELARIKDAKPKPPQKVDEIYEPKKPKRESFKYQPSFFKRMTMGKEKIAQIEDEKYQKQLKKYEEKLADYNNVTLPNYKKAKQDNVEALKEYKRLLAEQKRKIQDIEKEIEEAQVKFEDADKERYLEVVAAWEARREAHNKKFEQEVEEKGFVDRKSLRNYTFNVQKLGWINCDRFINSDINREPLMVNMGEQQHDMVFVIINDYKSALRANRVVDGRLQTAPIPQDLNVTILGVKVENGRPMLAKINTKTTANTVHDLAYRPCTLAEVRQELQVL